MNKHISMTFLEPYKNYHETNTENENQTKERERERKIYQNWNMHSNIVRGHTLKISERNARKNVKPPFNFSKLTPFKEYAKINNHTHHIKGNKKSSLL